MIHRKGQAVILAYVTVALLTVLGGSLLNNALTAQRQSQIQGLQADTFYYAEGGLEDAIAQFSNALANFQVATTVARYPATGSLVTTFSSGATASSVVNEISSGQNTVTDPDGISIFVKTYHITTTATHPTNPSVSVTLHQIFTRQIIYTFQHAVFYDQDLEWIPGANMTLSGRVHTNSDMYLAANGAILTVDSSYVHAAGNLYHKRKDDGSVPGGTVQIYKTGSSPASYPVLSTDSTSPTWATDSQTIWNGTVKTAVNGVTKRAVPVVGDTSPGAYYDTNAALLNNLQVVNGQLKQNGVPLTDGADVPPGTVTTSTTFYSNREGKYIKMTNIDMQKLAGYFDANGDGIPDPPGTPGNPYTNRLAISNGLIYATRNDASSSQEPGVRLINGSQISRTGGLTIVSNDPVYIQGDYNTVSKKPVAVIADAVNLLSNSWNDANSTSSLSSRVASPTTINAAFIAGNVPTPNGGGTYSGGLENYSRLHENWTSKTLAITGSFVSLWPSQIAKGNWVYGGNYYTAPIRSWSYDTSFSSGSSLPPYTPWAVAIVKGAWWKQ